MSLVMSTGKTADNARPERVTARRDELKPSKIEQCDIFRDIVFTESAIVQGNEIIVSEIKFPFAMCISQSCDLESDLRDRAKGDEDIKGNLLLQLIMVPLFPVEQFAEGSHWGELIRCQGIERKKMADLIKKNRDARYHYIKFPEGEVPGPFVADFKHFFTMSRDTLYGNMDKRLCSIKPLYRDDIVRRFANYMSRIGLPE